MARLKPLAAVWLISDARNDAVLEAALMRLPRGSGFIFRHYHLPQVERNIGLRRAQFGPFFLRFLHPVLAKHALSRGDQRGDCGGRMSFADRDQRYLFGAALRDLGGVSNARLHIAEGICWIGHRALL